jgi:hypothetical protein
MTHTTGINIHYKAMLYHFILYFINFLLPFTQPYGCYTQCLIPVAQAALQALNDKDTFNIGLN